MKFLHCKLKGREQKINLILSRMYPLSATTVCGAKFWQLLLCRTVIDFGASSHLAPALLSSSHFLRDPVKVRRGRNVNRGRFHRTMGRSRTIRLNVETATQSPAAPDLWQKHHQNIQKQTNPAPFCSWVWNGSKHTKLRTSHSNLMFLTILKAVRRTM